MRLKSGVPGWGLWEDPPESGLHKLNFKPVNARWIKFF